LEIKPERPKSPREQEAPARTKHLGSREEYGLLGRKKPLERQYQAGKFDRKASERKELYESMIRFLGKRKAL
jgi:hypothetical protein